MKLLNEKQYELFRLNENALVKATTHKRKGMLGVLKSKLGV